MNNAIQLKRGDFFSEYRNLERGSFDLILSDPPYNRLQEAGQAWDVRIDWDRTEGILASLVKPNGWIILFTDFLLAVELKNTFCHELEFFDKHIWHKPGGTPSNKYHPINDTELIMMFRKKEAKVSDLTFNPRSVLPVGEPYTKRNSSPDMPTRRQQKSPVNSNETGERWVKTILSGPSKPNMKLDERSSHPTQKPLNILQDLIRCYSNPGDLILDPFAGSASTLIAAHNENRKALGFEIEETFYLEARERIRRRLAQGELFQPSVSPNQEEML
ncbi:MAG: site-specific DNA-methyltransferase [Candidatus Marinimicrobia bacterium]|nr:site-specific DNA-methyltransferase [Candidatus Neomarinimicrobiota bacterium]